eukprot:UN28386
MVQQTAHRIHNVHNQFHASSFQAPPMHVQGYNHSYPGQVSYRDHPQHIQQPQPPPLLYNNHNNYTQYPPNNVRYCDNPQNSYNQRIYHNYKKHGSTALTTSPVLSSKSSNISNDSPDNEPVPICAVLTDKK